MVKEGAKVKWEYLQVYLNNEDRYVAFDGNSICDGDKDLISLLNKLGKDDWNYCGYVTRDTPKPCHLLKRNPKHINQVAKWNTVTWSPIDES